MKVGEFQVKWKHTSEEVVIRQITPLVTEVGVKRITECVVEDDSGNIYSKGKSICHVGDNFMKKTGRKMSFGRAIKQLYPNQTDTHKAGRKAMWEAYIQLRPQDFKG